MYPDELATVTVTVSVSAEVVLATVHEPLTKDFSAVAPVPLVNPPEPPFEACPVHEAVADTPELSWKPQPTDWKPAAEMDIVVAVSVLDTP